MISCVILSAGKSSRFGSPKALARINGETVIEHQQKTLLKTRINEIIIVLGAYAEEIEPFVFNSERINIVFNKNHKSGQTSSFKSGLEKVSSESKGVMLLPVDYPFVRPETFNVLSEKFLEIRPSIIVPVHGNKKGHPPIFSSNLKGEILSLSNSTGLNTLIHKYEEDIFCFPVEDAGVCKTFNTKVEFEKILEDNI